MPAAPHHRTTRGKTAGTGKISAGGDDVQPEHDELPIYSAQSISDALNATAVRRGSRSARRSPRTAHQPAGYVTWRPFAVLPWIGAILTLIWLPLVVVGAWWNVGALRQNHRGVSVAAMLLFLAVINHMVNDSLVTVPW